MHVTASTKGPSKFVPMLSSLLVRVLLLFAVVSRHRALRARRFTTSCWTFVALWLLLLVSELRLINQVMRDCSTAERPA